MRAWAPQRVNAVVQGVNLVLAIVGGIVLLVGSAPRATAQQVIALGVYAAGLLAVAACSALYAWGRNRPRHALYRRFDKAAIFLMIGGTYTPLILIGGGATKGLPLLAVVWTIALAGVLLSLMAPHRLERLSVPLYLLLGWAVLSSPGLLAGLPTPVTALLVAGGCLYTVGLLFHRAHMAFQEAIWHVFVLAGAACHYAAILVVCSS